jgi:cytochrome oxidase Cu insertion factor (SCO1/SenC/PrrC family)
MKNSLLVLTMLALTLAACGGAAPATESVVTVTTAPEFTLPNALGGEVSLSDYTGQPVFLFFHMAVG